MCIRDSSHGGIVRLRGGAAHRMGDAASGRIILPQLVEKTIVFEGYMVE